MTKDGIDSPVTRRVYSSIMTNSEIARAIGCHTTTVSTYRNGRRMPSVRLLDEIRKLLGITHDEAMELWTVGTEEIRRKGRSPTLVKALAPLFDEEAA